MYNKYSSKKTNYDFANLKEENNYNCQGSCCTCKYLNNRSPFDNQQIINSNQVLQNTHYEKAMFNSFKNKK
jgi:hypothetical protein